MPYSFTLHLRAHDNQFAIPEEGLLAGQLFGFGSDSPFSGRWGRGQGQTFELPSDGDQIFVYCLDENNMPNFLWGYSYNTGPWLDSGLPESTYGDKLGSALPSALQSRGSISQSKSQANNCIFAGDLAGSKDAIVSL